MNITGLLHRAYVARVERMHENLNYRPFILCTPISCSLIGFLTHLIARYEILLDALIVHRSLLTDAFFVCQKS